MALRLSSGGLDRNAHAVLVAEWPGGVGVRIQSSSRYDSETDFVTWLWDGDYGGRKQLKDYH